MDRYTSHGTAPQSRVKVAIWRYKDLRPLLLEAGKTVSAEDAERRVLILKNPALGKSHKAYGGIGGDTLRVWQRLASPLTTDTVYAGLQLIFVVNMPRYGCYSHTCAIIQLQKESG
jgi:gentisate 1,2-dioxygenase